MVKNKKGEEYVEAAMVLPILILTILSMILICVYYYESLANTAEMHRKAVTATQCRNCILSIYSNEIETSKPITGAVTFTMSDSKKNRIYKINEMNIVRAGKMVDFDK